MKSGLFNIAKLMNRLNMPTLMNTLRDRCNALPIKLVRDLVIHLPDISQEITQRMHKSLRVGQTQYHHFRIWVLQVLCQRARSEQFTVPKQTYSHYGSIILSKGRKFLNGAAQKTSIRALYPFRRTTFG